MDFIKLAMNFMNPW